MRLVLADFLLKNALAGSLKRLDSSAASEKAQARYLLPFLTFPFPLFLLLLVHLLGTLRQYDEYCPT